MMPKSPESKQGDESPSPRSTANSSPRGNGFRLAQSKAVQSEQLTKAQQEIEELNSQLSVLQGEKSATEDKLSKAVSSLHEMEISLRNKFQLELKDKENSIAEQSDQLTQLRVALKAEEDKRITLERILTNLAPDDDSCRPSVPLIKHSQLMLTTLHKMQMNLVKVAILGSEGVGKTSIISMLTDKTYSEYTTPTVGAMFIQKEIFIDETQYSVRIWDTAGQERFRTITPIYFRDAHGIILTYDVTNKKSFDDLHYWLNEVRSKGSKNASVFLFGNKCDAEQREVSESMARDFALEHGCKHLLVSAKTGLNLEEGFESLINHIINSGILAELDKSIRGSTQINRQTTMGKMSTRPDRTDSCKC